MPARFSRTTFLLSCTLLVGAASVYCSSEDAAKVADAPIADAAVDGTGIAPITPPPDAGSITKPNILFVLTDDLSWDLVAHMPNVLEMQKRGMTFSRYFVTESLCCPSRSTIFTGKYPHDTHVLANNGSEGGYGAYESNGNAASTFATALASQGYHGKMMGKFLNGYDPQKDQKDPGWAEWAVAGDGYDEFNYFLNVNGDAGFHGDAATDYLTDVMHTMAVDYATPANVPFLLEIASFAPHKPYAPAPIDVGTFSAGLPSNPAFNVANTNPPAWLATHKLLNAKQVKQLNESFNRRVESVQAVDRMIGDLMAKLAASGLDKSTYIVFSSDNGFHLGQHQLLAGKQTAFDTDINVPLIVVGPGVAAGVVDDHLVANIDLCPTFAELGGAPALPTADGRSIVDLLHGKPVTDWRNVILVEHKNTPMTPDDPDNENEDAGALSDPTTYDAIRMTTGSDGGRHDSVFVSYESGESEYYDIDSDPFEMTNTASTLDPATVTKLKDAVSKLKACQGAASCWAAEHM